MTAEAVAQAAAAAASLKASPAILSDGFANEGTLKRTVKTTSLQVAESIRDRLSRDEPVLLSICRHGTDEAIMGARVRGCFSSRLHRWRLGRGRCGHFDEQQRPAEGKEGRAQGDGNRRSSSVSLNASFKRVYFASGALEVFAMCVAKVPLDVWC